MATSRRKPWIGPKWTSSWLNFEPSVTKDLSFPHKIELEDWTLQGDGEETPGIVFSREEALSIASKLDEVGVPRIMAGLVEPLFPEDGRIVKEIAHLGLRAKVGTIAGLSKVELDRAISYDVWELDIAIAAADFWLPEKRRLVRRDEAIKQVQIAMSYCKAHGVKVRLNVRDPARADPVFVRRVLRSVSNLADAIRVTEPYGMVSPFAFGKMIRMLRRWTDLPIAVHCHNDLGLATANALAGLASGASIPNTTVNGIGERCGLSSLEEVAVALRILYNVDTGIKFDKLYDLSQLVERATGHLISTQKPIVGKRAFGWESDRSVPSKARFRVPFEPEFVGNSFRFFPGRKLGIQGVRRTASTLGFELTDRQAERLVAKVRELSGAKKQPSDAEFLKLLRRVGSATNAGTGQPVVTVSHPRD